jgi:hypothetical protein
MRLANKNLLFPEYRNRGILYLVYKMVRYSMLFQLLFYSVMGNYFFLGSMDHLLSKPGIVSATNKDSIKITRCVALYDVICFNSGSYLLSFYMLCLAYATVLKDTDWDYESMPPDLLYSLLFAGPAAFMSVMAFIVPLLLNPFVVSADKVIWDSCPAMAILMIRSSVWLILVFVSTHLLLQLGWPFNPPLCSRKKEPQDDDASVIRLHKRTPSGGKVVDLKTFMGATVDPAKELMMESGRVEGRPDVELGSLATNDFGSKYPISVASPDMTMERKRSIATHSKKVLGDDGNDNAMGNKVYGHVTLYPGARESRPSNGSGHHQGGVRGQSNGLGHQAKQPRSESTMQTGGIRDSTNKRQSLNSSQHSRRREKKPQSKSGLAMI